jgi:ferrous iron transport protein B
MQDSKNLASLLPGQRGIILSLDVPNGSLRRRLIDMGLTPGTEVGVKRIAPFGDPIEVTIRGYELSLRRSEAAQISIGREGYARPKRGGGRGSRSYISRPRNQEALRRRAAHRQGGSREERIALVGNPNSGKTTLFNALTGGNQYVGNWPGVTVERKEGQARIDGKTVTVVDLPGIYSLSPYSMEEIIARDFIINDTPDVIINIVDATNLERNLYLTVQLLELERPMVVALNFMDEVDKKGDRIDAKVLSEKMGIPVVPITARSGENLDELMEVACRQMRTGFTVEPDELYDEYTQGIHHRIDQLIHDRAGEKGLPSHWASIKLLEGDKVVEQHLDLDAGTLRAVEDIIREYEASSEFGDRETMIAHQRYCFIESITAAALRRGRGANAQTISDRIDRIATHKYFAVPLFLVAMFIVFSITFGPVGSFLSNSMGLIMENYIGVWVQRALEVAGAADWLVSLCVDGIIAGVGGVLSFLPQIALLFIFLSFMEDCGYMARAAFIMDRLLKRLGLSGKAFIPMLMGFGCSVPAIMGSRTMENQKDKRMTIMLVPFMSCSAKLPVYGLISAAFLGRRAGIVVFSLYVLGVLMAIASGLIFRKTIFRGETAVFVMELPPYRLPTLGNTLQHVWERVRDFLARAGTLILLMSIVLWFLQSFDAGFNMVGDPSDSILGSLGGFIAPIFKPMGYGTWQAAVALLTGLVAKEAVVASLSMFYGFNLTADSAVIAAALSGTFASPLAAFAFLVFILLYVPCVAAVSAAYRELGSLKWTAALIGWQVLVAYTVSLVVYQLGSLIGLA